MHKMENEIINQHPLSNINFISQNLFRKRKCETNEDAEDEEDEEENKEEVRETAFFTKIIKKDRDVNKERNNNNNINNNNNKNNTSKNIKCQKDEKGNNDELKNLREREQKRLRVVKDLPVYDNNYVFLLRNVLSNESCLIYQERNTDKRNFQFNLKSAVSYASKVDKTSLFQTKKGTIEELKEIVSFEQHDQKQQQQQEQQLPPLFFSDSFASNFLKKNKINIFIKAREIFGRKTNFKRKSAKKLRDGGYEITKKQDPKTMMGAAASISSFSRPTSSPRSRYFDDPVVHAETTGDDDCSNSEIFTASFTKVLEEYAKEFSSFESNRQKRFLYLVLNNINNDHNNNYNNVEEELEFRLLKHPKKDFYHSTPFPSSSSSSVSFLPSQFDKIMSKRNYSSKENSDSGNCRPNLTKIDGRKMIRIEVPTSFLHASYICEMELVKLGIMISKSKKKRKKKKEEYKEENEEENGENFLSYLERKSKNLNSRIIDENERDSTNFKISRVTGKRRCYDDKINNDQNNNSNDAFRTAVQTDLIWQSNFEEELENQIMHLISLRSNSIKESSVKVIKDIIRKYFYYNAVLYLCNEELIISDVRTDDCISSRDGDDDDDDYDKEEAQRVNIFPSVPSNYLALKMFFYARGSQVCKRTFIHQLSTINCYIFQALSKDKFNRVLAENFYFREYFANKDLLKGDDLKLGNSKKSSLSAATIVSTLKFLFITIKTGEKILNGGRNNDSAIKRTLKYYCFHLLYLYFGMTYFCRWSDVSRITVKMAIDLLYGLPFHVDSKAKSKNVPINEDTGECGGSHTKQRFPHVLGLPTHVLVLLGFNVVELNTLTRYISSQNKYNIGSVLSESLISGLIADNEETKSRLLKSAREYNDGLHVAMGFDVGLPPPPSHSLMEAVYETDIRERIERHYGFDAINHLKFQTIRTMMNVKRIVKFISASNTNITSPTAFIADTTTNTNESDINSDIKNGDDDDDRWKESNPNNYNNIKNDKKQAFSIPSFLPLSAPSLSLTPPPVPRLNSDRLFFPECVNNKSVNFKKNGTRYFYSPSYSFKNNRSKYPFYYEESGKNINTGGRVPLDVAKLWRYSPFNNMVIAFKESGNRRNSQRKYRILNFGDLAFYALYILVCYGDLDLEDRIFPSSSRGQERLIKNMILCDYVNFGIPNLSAPPLQQQQHFSGYYNNHNNNNVPPYLRDKKNEDFDGNIFLRKPLKDRIEIAKLHLVTNSREFAHIYRVSAFSMVVDSLLSMVCEIGSDNKSTYIFGRYFKLFGEIHLSHDQLKTHFRYFNKHASIQRAISDQRGNFSARKHTTPNSARFYLKPGKSLNEKVLNMVLEKENSGGSSNSNNGSNNNSSGVSIPAIVAASSSFPISNRPSNTNTDIKDTISASFWYVQLYSSDNLQKKRNDNAIPTTKTTKYMTTTTTTTKNGSSNNDDDGDDQFFSRADYSFSRVREDDGFWDMMISNYFFHVDDFTLTPKIVSIAKKDLFDLDRNNNGKRRLANNRQRRRREGDDSVDRKEIFVNEGSDEILVKKARKLLEDKAVILSEKMVLHKNQIREYKF